MTTLKEELDKECVSTFDIEMPSGNKLSITGKFFLMPTPGDEASLVPVIFFKRKDSDSKNDALILDPRAKIFSSVKMVYSPRMSDPDTLGLWVRNWLKEHSEW